LLRLVACKSADRKNHGFGFLAVRGLIKAQAVVDSGGFAAAARRLGLSPASVIHHIKSLRGSPRRSAAQPAIRKVSLTEIGTRFYERYCHILAELEEAEKFASTVQMAPRGTLRVNTTVTVAHVVARLIKESWRWSCPTTNLCTPREPACSAGLGRRLIG